MTRKKALMVLAMLLASVLLLAACEEGRVNSTLTIASADGAGTAEYVLSVRKAGSIQENGEPCDNDLYLPSGMDGLFAAIQAATRLPDASVTMADVSDDYYEITIAFAFDSIDDYNAKLAGLVDGARISPAEWIVDGDTVEFYEDMMNFTNIVMAYAEIIHGNPDAYDPKAGDPNKPDSDDITADYMVDERVRTVIIGDQVVSRDFASEPGDFEMTVALASLDGAPEPAEEAPAEEAPAEDEPAAPAEEAAPAEAPAEEAPAVETPTEETAPANPRTGVGSTLLVVGIITLVASLVGLRITKRRHNKEMKR